MYLDRDGNVIRGSSTKGYLAAAVPGNVAGFELALAKYGTMKRAAVMAPAIRLARRGFVLEQGDVDLLAIATRDFREDAPSAAVFPAQRTAATRRGERLVQKDLARTLERIARRVGTPASTKGPSPTPSWRPACAGGGIFTKADLARYRAKERAPIECEYRGYGSSRRRRRAPGGVVLCEILGILEALSAAGMGLPGPRAPCTTRSRRCGTRIVDRNSYLGDPDFVRNPVERLLDESYAAQIRAAIDPGKAGSSRDLEARRRAARRSEHDALFDRRQGRQRGRGHVHAQRMVRRKGDGGDHRHHHERRDGRLHRRSRRAQRLRAGARRGQRDRARQAAAVLDVADDRLARRQARAGHRHAGRQPHHHRRSCK